MAGVTRCWRMFELVAERADTCRGTLRLVHDEAALQRECRTCWATKVVKW